MSAVQPAKSAGDDAARRLSLRKLAFWVPVWSTLMLVLGVVVVVLMSDSVIRLAESVGGRTATRQMEALRAVGNLERLIALGDHFNSERDPARWREAGLTMQALAAHPSIASLAGRSSVVAETFDTVAVMMAWRSREVSPEVLPAEAEALQRQREVMWQSRRAALKEVADKEAVRVVSEHTRAADEIADGMRSVLMVTLGGAIIVAVSGMLLILLVRRQVVAPLVSLSDYLHQLRKGAQTLPALPRARSVEMGAVVDAAGVLAASQQALEHAALHDTLTGLSNRYGLEARLEQAMAYARRHGKRLAVMFVDLDRFKTINDSFGHNSGDDLLRIIADRYRACLRDTDLVARLGGDEFVVVMNELDNASDAIPVVRKLLEATGREMNLGQMSLRLTASVGIALFPDNGEDVSTLMKHADIAMYHVKARGRSGFQFFDAAMHAAVAERLSVETSLIDALRRNEFQLHYQPQMSADGTRVVAVEALIRWRRADGSMVSPADFIPVAEECGMILPIGEWVLRQALKTLHGWRCKGLRDIRMAVNLSVLQLRDVGLPALLKRLLAEFDIPPEALELEVTESMAMSDPEKTIAILHDLRALGVSLSIDDFGTGYSSLAYLKLFPIDRLKLDRTFVRDIEADSADADICTATVVMAHSLKLQLVAEGVETYAQFDFLRKLGCDLLQGYYFHRPLSAAAVETLLLSQQAQIAA